MSYIGKNPKADSVKLNSTAVIPTGAAVEGQVYYNDGTGTISEGLKVYKNGNFVGIDKQLGDADTIALKKAVDVGSLQWTVAINSTSTTVGMNDPIPQYNATATGFVSASSTFSNTSTGNALLTDESSDLVFAYESHTVNSKNDYYGIQIDIPKAFRGGNLVLSFEYRTAEASGATSDDDFRVSVQDNTTANRGQTTSGTGVTGSQAAGTSILVGSSTNFTVGDRVRVESGTGIQGAQANDFTEAYVTAIADATHLTFSQTIVFPSTVGALIAGGWLTDKVQGQLVEADSDTNKVGKKRSIQFKTLETTETINVTFQNLSTSAAGIDLFVDNILLSANKFLQASSMPKQESLYASDAGTAYSTGNNHIPYFQTTDLNTISSYATYVGNDSTDGTSLTILKDCIVYGEVMFRSTGTGEIFGFSKNATSTECDTNLQNIDMSKVLTLTQPAGSQYEKVSFEQKFVVGDVIRPHGGNTIGGFQSFTDWNLGFTITPIQNDVIILESQDEIFTDWVDYTPTYNGLGTVTTKKAAWRRAGPNMEIMAQFTTGTVSANPVYFTIPSGYNIKSMSTDTVLVECGRWMTIAADSYSRYLAFRNTAGEEDRIYFTLNSGSYNAMTVVNGNQILGTENVSAILTVPIQGWNANFNPLLSMPLVEIGANVEGYRLNGGAANSTSFSYRPYFDSTSTYYDFILDTINNLGVVDNNSTNGWNFKATQRVKVNWTGSFGSNTGAGNWALVKTSHAPWTGTTVSNNAIGNSQWDGLRVASNNSSGAGEVSLISASFIMEPGDYIQVVKAYTGNETVAYVTGINMTVEKDFSNTNMAHIIKPAVANLLGIWSYTEEEGTVTTGSWQDRVLNTIEGESWFVTLSGTGTTGSTGTNTDFTLDPGTYKIKGRFPFFLTSYTFMRLYDVTNSVALTAGGSQGNWYFKEDIGVENDGNIFIDHTLTVTSATEYKFQYNANNTAAGSWGLGPDSGTQSTQLTIGATVQIEKLK